MKKLLSLVLATVMLLSILNVSVFADGYTVTYYNGSSAVGNSATVIAGGSYALDRVVENTDTQYFAGWYLDSAFTQQAKSTITVNANTNLYAKMVDYSSNLTIEAKSGSLFTDGGWASPKHYLRDTYYTYYNLIGAYGVSDGKYYDLMPEGQHHRHAGGTDSGNSYEDVDGVKVEKMEHVSGSYWANYGNGNGEYILRQPDGEAFMVKPNTTYIVKLTYKFQKTVDDASHYTKFWLSTGLTNNYPMYSGELNLNDETNTTSNSRGNFNDIANRTFAATTKSDLVLVDTVTDEWTTMTMTITTPSLETYKNGNYLQVLSLSTATTFDVKSLWKSVTVEEVLPESCNVTYMNGESVVGIAENIVEGSSFTIDRAVANTDTHYFAGWYTDSALTKKATTKITVSEDTTLYAKMVPYASAMSISATQWNYNYRETVSSWYPYHEAYFANYYGAYNGVYKDIVKLNTGTFAGYRTSSESRKVLAYGHGGGYNIGSTFVIMNANGEAFIPKPNTTYKVSVTYASDTTSSAMKIGTGWTLTDTTLKATGDYAFSGKDLSSSSYVIGGGISGNPVATSEAVEQINTNGATTTAEFIITTPSLAEYSGKLQALGLYGFNVKSALYGSPVSNNIFFIDSVSVEETVVDTSVDVVYMNGSAQVGETATVEQGAEYVIDRAVANTDTHYFAGWYTDSALTKKATTKITVSEDTTLYAKMVPYASAMSVSGSAWKYNYREQVNGWYPHNEIYYGNYYAVSGGAYKDILKIAGGTFAAYGTVNGSKVLSYGHNNDYGIASSYVIMDANGEIFVPKPNTMYKISVKYYSNTTSSNMKVGTAWDITDTTLKATGDYAFTSATNGYEYTTSSPTIGGGISGNPAVSSEAVAQVVTSEPTVAEFIITTPTLEDYNGKLQALGLYGFNVKGARNNYGFYISQVSVEEYVPEYSVTYMNGSAQVGEAVTGLSENASYTIDRVVENTNTHYFAGWYLDPDFNTEALSTITVDGEVTLYAKMVEYKKTLSVASSSDYWQGWVSPKHYLRDNYFEYRVLVGAYGIKNGKYGDLLSEGYAHRHSGGSGGGNTAIADANGVRNETRDTTSGTWQYYTSGDYILRDANGNAFIVKPDTTYKVTLTYTFDISNNANGKASYFLGTGLDASKLLHSGEMVLNDVSGDRIASSDYSTYGFSDGTNLSFLSEGVKVQLVPTADNKTVELFITTPSLEEYKNNNSLQVLSICDEQSSNTVTSWKSVVVEELDNKIGDVFGHSAVKVADVVEDKHSYKVTVLYKASAAAKIGFFTADADNAGSRGYVEGKNVAVYTTSVNDGTVVTTDVYLTVDKYGNTGEALYLYIIDDAENIVIYDAKAEKITNVNGGYLIGNAGVSMINTTDVTLNQALRYYFTYDTTNASDIIINGKSYSIVERGFLYANGSRVSDETIVSRTNIGNAIVGTSTNDFTKCWTTKQNTDGTLNLWFSSYVKDFASENGSYNASKRLYVKGYVVVEINGEQFTFYTTESNYTVAEIAALNNFHNEGNFAPGESNLPIAAGNRSLVWNLEFNGESDYDKITTDTTTMEPSANSTILSVSPSRENIFIEDGNLTLRIKDNGEDAPVRYTTAKSLTTDGKMAFKYGYLEMRAKVPFTTAMFPSFWMQPDKRLLADDFKYYGEVDIFEVYGDAQNLSTTIMKWDHNYNPVAPYGSLVHDMGYRFGEKDEYNEYQIYGMEWTPEYFKFYVNGVLTHTIRIDEEYNSQYAGMECFNDFYYLCWNNFAYEDALEEYWLGDDPDGDGFGEDHVDYIIDYVRLYQNKDTEEIVLY